MILSDVCLSVCLTYVAYIVNIHGAHSWKQGALAAAGVRRAWAGAGPQRAAYRGGDISCGLAHSLLLESQFTTIDYTAVHCLCSPRRGSGLPR